MTNRRWMLKLIATGTAFGWAVSALPVATPAQQSRVPETLRTLPYSAAVVRAMEQVRQGLALGQGEAALKPLHQLLDDATPALTPEQLLLHREVARAFIELGFSDHALRTLSVALQDAIAANQHEQALAIREELDAAYAAFRNGLPAASEPGAARTASEGRSDHTVQAVQPVGLFDRFLGRPRRRHQHQPVPGTVWPQPSQAPVVTDTTAAVPAPAAPNAVVPHTHQHNGSWSAAYPAPRPRVSLWHRFKHFFHQFRPQPPAARPWPPRVVQPQPRPRGLPQYPQAQCETCRKRQPYPSLATPPPPPVPGPTTHRHSHQHGHVQPLPAAPTAPGAVPMSPYSVPQVAPGHVHRPTPRIVPLGGRRPSLWQRIKQGVKASLGRFTRPPSRPTAPMVSPQWPQEAVQMGNTLQGEPIR